MLVLPIAIRDLLDIPWLQPVHSHQEIPYEGIPLFRQPLVVLRGPGLLVGRSRQQDNRIRRERVLGVELKMVHFPLIKDSNVDVKE